MAVGGGSSEKWSHPTDRIIMKYMFYVCGKYSLVSDNHIVGETYCLQPSG
jgi:hypothetical protein